LDLQIVTSIRYADRSLITLTNMHHSDFTSFAMIASTFDLPINGDYANTGWDRKTAQQGFENTCRIVQAFLDKTIKGTTGGGPDFHQIVQEIKGSTWARLPAAYGPPSPREVVALARQGGLDAVKSIIERSAGQEPKTSCVDLVRFNSYGYELLGRNQTKDARFVFEIAAWAHPTSANAQDSLADGLFADGEAAAAKAAIQRAIDLAPTDKSLSPEAKAQFISEEKRRLSQSN